MIIMCAYNMGTAAIFSHIYFNNTLYAKSHRSVIIMSKPASVPSAHQLTQTRPPWTRTPITICYRVCCSGPDGFAIDLVLRFPTQLCT